MKKLLGLFLKLGYYIDIGEGNEAQPEKRKEKMRTANAKLVETDSKAKISWYEISGTDFGTGFELNSFYGITADNKILDENGSPLTDGDTETIAVKKSLGIY